MIHLIKNKEGKPIGWELRPITEEEIRIASTIRNLQFFGYQGSKITYVGRKMKDEDTIEKIGWIQKDYAELWPDKEYVLVNVNKEDDLKE